MNELDNIDDDTAIQKIDMANCANCLLYKTDCEGLKEGQGLCQDWAFDGSNVRNRLDEDLEEKDNIGFSIDE